MIAQPDALDVVKQKLNKYAHEVVHSHSALLRILPSRPVMPDELQFDDEHGSRPMKLYEIEREGKPTRKLHTLFERIVTPRFVMVQERFLQEDPRERFKELFRDVASELDNRLLHCADLLLYGVNKEVPETGKVQWWQVDAPPTRDSVTEAIVATGKLLLFEPKFAVVGKEFARTVLSFSHADGYDEPPLEFTEFGLTWRVVDRDYETPKNSLYLFGKPDELGRTYTLQDACVTLDLVGPNAEFFVDMIVGTTLHNVSHVTRIDFAAPEE